MTLGCRRTLSPRAHISLREGYTCTSPKANGARWDLWFLSGTALSFPFSVARSLLSALYRQFVLSVAFILSLGPSRLSLLLSVRFARQMPHIYGGLTKRLPYTVRSEEHTSELQSRGHLLCRP